MIGEDITQVLPVEADTEVELTDEVREPFKQMNEQEKSYLFYSALRGYGRK